MKKAKCMKDPVAFLDLLGNHARVSGYEDFIPAFGGKNIVETRQSPEISTSREEFLSLEKRGCAFN